MTLYSRRYPVDLKIEPRPSGQVIPTAVQIPEEELEVGKVA